MLTRNGGGRRVDTRRKEVPPYGSIGMSTAFRISDGLLTRTMEFRRVFYGRTTISIHAIAHDEIYYILSGEGIVQSDGERRCLTLGMTAYLFDGASVGTEEVRPAPCH